MSMMIAAPYAAICAVLAKPKIEIDLHTRHFFSEKIYAKQMKLPKGHFAVSHKHNYDHLSILASGIAEVTTDTETRQYTAPSCIEIKAGIEHTIVAIEDVSWFCIHAISSEDRDVNKIDQVLIEKAPEHCHCAACSSGTLHDSDCSVHNMPAFPNKSCDCSEGVA